MIRPLIQMSLSVLAFLVAGCAHNGAASNARPLESGEPVNGWTTVALTLDGSELDARRKMDCANEAHHAGVRLAADGTVKGTLRFLKNGDSLESEVLPRGRYQFPLMDSWSECRIALAKLVNLDGLVKHGKMAPQTCAMLGPVEGTDRGSIGSAGVGLLSTNNEAAIVDALFNVRAMGGNFFEQDRFRAAGVDLVVSGVAFACPP
jgi:hypothetical protein